MISNDRRLKQADDEKNKDYREKDQEHKGSAMRCVGIIVHI
jgi:hypothetical protein